MKRTSRRPRYPSKNTSSQQRWSRATRRLRVEQLESRVVLSHNGGDAVNWEMPADLVQQIAADMTAVAEDASAISIYPGATISFDTLANGMPILNSLPSAPAAIFLDFDGGTYHGSETLGAYDTDGNPAVFGTAEQHAIYEAWRQISMYFSMFNVNVTTIDTTKPKAWILPSDSGNGGVSYVNVFPDSRPESKTGTSTVTSRISAIAHELGHNFGMWHISQYDSLGVKTAEYSSEFDPLHGPIMGIDYEGVIHKWMYWHNSTGGPIGVDDDMAIIANDLDNYGGDGYRPDDYGAAMNAGTTPLLNFGVTQSRVGIIERLTDQDAFSLTSAGGRYAIVVGRDAPSGVDLKLSVFDAAGHLLASEDGDPRGVPTTMVNDQHLTLDLPAGTYYALVESHGNYDDQGQYTIRVDPMPDGLSAEDVGLVGVPGYSSYDSSTGTYTVTGSGSDISSTSDGFQFLYQTLSGNGTIVARVASQENTNFNAKAGVMIRESLADNAKNAMMLLKPGGSAAFQYRFSTGGSTGTMNASFSSSWQYVRLTRAGNTITAAVSTDGMSWTTVDSQTVVMGSNVLIGLATTARNNLKLNTSTFTDVTVTGDMPPGPVLNGLPATTSLSALKTTSNSADLSWTGVALYGDANGDGLVNSLDLDLVKVNFGAAGSIGAPGDVNGDGRIDIIDYNLVKNNINGSSVGYAVERSSDGINFVQIGVTAAGVTTYTVTGLADFQRYFFRIRTLGSGNTVSQPSDIVSAVTKAGAVSSVATISYSTSKNVIDWRDASGEANYRVQRSTDGGDNWTTRSTLPKNSQSYADTGLTGTTYSYRIQTLDSGGNVVATSAVVTESTRLAIVTGLVFTNQAANQLTFQWNAVANASGYRVERSLDNETFSTIASNVSATSYADNNVSAGTTYYYRVTGLKSGLTESASPSSVISAAPPAGAAESGASGVASSSQSGRGGTALVPPDDANSVVKSVIRKFEHRLRLTKLSSQQKAAVEHVLLHWNFDRSDRALSKSLLKALHRAEADRLGISLQAGVIDLQKH
ncbi:MAG: hypothetical protein IT427_01605 [Pirellulales bacterium]|nr:hypothetical protein [Pirellulales bacterium]